MNEDEIQAYWQEQTMTNITPTLDILKERDTRFDACIRRRNIIEYTTGGIVSLVFLLLAVGAFGLPEGLGAALMRVGAGLIIAGFAVVACQLWRRTGLRAGDMAGASVDHYLGELRRQRDALRIVWLWYVLPLAPGFLMFFAGVGLLPGVSPVVALTDAGLTTAILAGIAWLNARAARKLDIELNAAQDLVAE